MIFFKRVVSESDAEVLRVVRNECREFMTRHTDYITQEQQQKWFKTAFQNYDIFLVYNVEHGVIIYEIGFGLIHKYDDCFMLSGGLISSERGKGFGKNIFQFLMDQCHKSLPIKLELLKDNTAAFKTYKKLKFKTVSVDNKLTYMEFKHDSVI